MSEEKETALAEQAPQPAEAKNFVGTLPMEEHPAWPMISHIPVALAVNIPVRGFRVCDLLALENGQTIASEWVSTEEVPLKAGSRQLSWGEFEVVDDRLALRLTRLV